MMTSLLNALRRPSITNEPPSPAEQRRNDLLVVAVTVVAVLLGLAVEKVATSSTTSVSLGGNLPTVHYPANWLVDQSAEGLLLRAQDLRSDSSFDARLELFARDARPAETLEDVSTSWPLSRNRQYEKYRILSTQTLTLAGGQPAMLITYAYVADPTREHGMTGLPVVVKAQDLAFIANDGAADRLVVVTVAADATEWNAHVGDFEGIQNNLLRTGEASATPGPAEKGGE
jgi:hypothetical protein